MRYQINNKLADISIAHRKCSVVSTWTENKSGYRGYQNRDIRSNCLKVYVPAGWNCIGTKNMPGQSVSAYSFVVPVTTVFGTDSVAWIRMECETFRHRNIPDGSHVNRVCCTFNSNSNARFESVHRSHECLQFDLLSCCCSCLTEHLVNILNSLCDADV
jgi:hypothetical protein